MAEEAKPAVAIRDFLGLQTNVDPDDLPTGAASEQVNIATLVPGQLQARRGLRQVRFGILQ